MKVRISIPAELTPGKESCCREPLYWVVYVLCHTLPDVQPYAAGAAATGPVNAVPS